LPNFFIIKLQKKDTRQLKTQYVKNNFHY
jgi:hypothetical protein